MNWITTEPTQPGIYLAMMKGTGEMVGACVLNYEFSPGNDLPPGMYCQSYTGPKSHVMSGHPRGCPMADTFSTWALVHPICDPNTQ